VFNSSSIVITHQKLKRKAAPTSFKIEPLLDFFTHICVEEDTKVIIHMSYNYLNLNIISVLFPLHGYLHILTINLRFGPFWIKRKEEEGEKKERRR
jgi:hypothetical protein